MTKTSGAWLLDMLSLNSVSDRLLIQIRYMCVLFLQQPYSCEGISITECYLKQLKEVTV